MSDSTAPPPIAATDSPSDVLGSPKRLTGRMTATALALSVLAFSAPIATVTGFIPIAIAVNGEGAAFAFLAAGVLMLLFSVGYMAMTRSVPKPGAFYTFVTNGLGKEAGLGAAYVATVSYFIIMAGLYCFFGISTVELITGFGGPETPWWLWTIAGWAFVSVLGYFHIELSARILTVVMVFEVLLVLIFDVVVVAQGGAEGPTFAAFLPTTFAQGDMAVTLLFAILTFIGFEATALFRDEVRTPNKTVPRATYSAVAFIALLYSVSAFALTTAYGSSAQEIAINEPATMFTNAIMQYAAPFFAQVTYVLVVTSVIASALCLHNILARYIFNLAADRALPHTLSAVHTKHHSPYRASNAVAGLVVIVLILLAVFGADAGTIYARLSGLGSTGIICLMVLVSVAIIGWFARKRKAAGENVFVSYIAPALTALALGVILIFAILRFDLVVGGAPGELTWLVLLHVVAFVGGVAVALYMRARKPAVYRGLGRAEIPVVDAMIDAQKSWARSNAVNQ